MPIIQSAKKKMRQDKKRTLINAKIKNVYKQAVKQARLKPTEKILNQAYHALDTAAKKHVIHANKASRLKSRLMKLARKGKIVNTEKETKRKRVTKKVKQKSS